MTREDIIRMAREAGCKPFRSPEYWDDVQVFATPDVLERFAALIAAAEQQKMMERIRHIIVQSEERGAAAEREACAAVCCDMIDAEYKTGKVDHNEMAWTQACAIAIRARGNT